jgi:hypothetical protein
MFTTGSKFLIGSTVIAIACAIAYGLTQHGVMGTVGLVSAAIALAFLTGINLFTRDNNVFVTDDLVVEATAAAQPAAGWSGWPLGFALGAMVVAVGLVTYQAIFLIGLVLMAVTGAEWAVQAWAERASSNSAYNAAVRSRLVNPFEFPVAGLLAIGVIVYAVSRVMLHLAKNNTVALFVVLALCVLGFAALIAANRRLRTPVIATVITVAVLSLIVTAFASALSGERQVQAHETTGGSASEGICENPNKTEADKKASQNVAASANVAAIITLDSAGKLSYEVNGPIPKGQADNLFLTRSAPNNVIFVNNSDADRRLSVDLGTKVVKDESGKVVKDDSGKDKTEPNQACTTLVNSGGARQLITLNIPQPSLAFPDGFHFFVPGVDSARLGLTVP